MDAAIYECLICKYESPWLFAFQFHQKNHSCLSDHTCSYFDCFQKLPGKEQHGQKHEGSQRKCGSSKKHDEEKKCSGENKQSKIIKPVFECNHCSSFKTFYYKCLTRHMSSKHNIFENVEHWKFCDYCPRKFREQDLREHLRWCHFSSGREVHLGCTKCPYKAESSNDLKIHQECTGHGNGEAEKLHQCPQCLYGTDYKGDFDKHMLRRHTKLKDVRRWFKCENCPYKAKENKHLTQHILNMHTKQNELQWFECAQCGHRAKNKAHLRGHISNVHSDSRPKFKCSCCDFQSFQKSTVTRHKLQRQHLDYNLYKN